MGIICADAVHLPEVAFYTFKLMFDTLDVPFGEKLSSGCNVLQGTTYEIVRMLTTFTSVFVHHQQFTVI